MRAHYLDSEEMIAAYLDEAMATGDAEFIAHARRNVARARDLAAAGFAAEKLS